MELPLVLSQKFHDSIKFGKVMSILSHTYCTAFQRFFSVNDWRVQTLNLTSELKKSACMKLILQLYLQMKYDLFPSPDNFSLNMPEPIFKCDW